MQFYLLPELDNNDIDVLNEKWNNNGNCKEITKMKNKKIYNYY